MKLTQANTLRHGATLHSLVKPTTRTSAAKNVCRINQHKAVVVAAAAKGTKAAAGGEKNPIERLKEISKDAIQKKEAQKSQLEEANNKLAAALKDLEVAKAEAASAAKLRDEVELRTRAMENLQLQLEQVEALRNQELQASMKRFEELESALALAEGSMGSEAQRVTQLEARMASMAGELEAAAKQADDLRQQLKAAKEGTGKDVVADALEVGLLPFFKIFKSLFFSFLWRPKAVFIDMLLVAFYRRQNWQKLRKSKQVLRAISLQLETVPSPWKPNSNLSKLQSQPKTLSSQVHAACLKKLLKQPKPLNRSFASYTKS